VATQWGRIKAAWLKGGVTYSELAEKYHLSEKTIRNRAYKEGWRKEKGQIEDEVKTATRARIVRAKVEQLEMLIAANESMAKALMALAARISENPDLLMGGKNDGKPADAISKAIETTARTQRDLHKLPTLDQDMQKKEFAFRKKMDTAKSKLDREKWEDEKRRRAEGLSGGGGVIWETTEPEGEELDG